MWGDNYRILLSCRAFKCWDIIIVEGLLFLNNLFSECSVPCHSLLKFIFLRFSDYKDLDCCFKIYW